MGSVGKQIYLENQTYPYYKLTSYVSNVIVQTIYNPTYLILPLLRKLKYIRGKICDLCQNFLLQFINQSEITHILHGHLNHLTITYEISGVKV